jgi:hypothetical protein
MGLAAGLRSLLLLAALALLTACAGPRYTVDDGRRLDEALLSQLRSYGEGERRLRPAIARSAQLRDAECDKQWELPFAVATSEGWSEDERVAWVRSLGVDERLAVLAAAPGSPLKTGDKLVRVGQQEGLGEALLEALAALRDAGQPFGVTLSDGRRVQVQPFEVCRGYTRLAPPNTPRLQDYHWLLSLHPLELMEGPLSEDQALWVVLWTQGLSEVGGARMKTYHYGSQFIGTLYNLATLASGLKGAALAAEGALKAARSAAGAVASELLKQQLVEQGKALALQKIREGLADAASQLSRQQVLTALQQAAVNRGSLSGVSRIAATVFDRADAWAYARMGRLGANPLAAFSLQQQLMQRGAASNAIALDAERLSALTQLAQAQGLREAALALLGGVQPEELQRSLAAMPLASAPRRFSYDSPDDPGASPYAQGLVEALIAMPVESGRKPR